jgi:GNAT superfamily N-acetyltransferase
MEDKPMDLDANPAIRVATPADADVGGRLLDEFRREFDTPTPGPKALAGRLEDLLPRDDVLLVLAGAPTEPVGLALLILRPTSLVEGRAGLLEELYVAPAHRGRRIGGALLERAVELARGRGAEVIEVPVDEGDTDARRFYERHAFSNRSAPDDDERMLFYERPLTERNW